MSQVIDVTGLSADAVRAVESLVGLLRDAAPATAPAPAPAPSVFDLIGKAPVLRSGEDIARQLHEERDAWGEP